MHRMGSDTNDVTSLGPIPGKHRSQVGVALTIRTGNAPGAHEIVLVSGCDLMKTHPPLGEGWSLVNGGNMLG